MTDRPARRPLHLAVALGVSAGVYATTLAAVAGLQSRADAEAAAAVRPGSDAATVLHRLNEALAADVDRARAAYAAAGDGYGRVAAALATTDQGLASAASTVAALEGAAVKLPASAPLPQLRSVRTVAAPAVHATTGASGQPR